MARFRPVQARNRKQGPGMAFSCYSSSFTNGARHDGPVPGLAEHGDGALVHAARLAAVADDCLADLDGTPRVGDGTLRVGIVGL